MNCDNCGAPFEAVSRSGVLQCSYCESRRVLSEQGYGLDGVVLLSTPTDLDCPSCGDQLVAALIDDHGCRACPSCFGVEIRQSDFGDLVAVRRSAYAGADVRPMPLNPAELRITRDCPHCRESMEVHPYFGPGNTVIDSCSRCGLVWLDAGEMSAIEKTAGRR